MTDDERTAHSYLDTAAVEVANALDNLTSSDPLRPSLDQVIRTIRAAQSSLRARKEPTT